MKILKKAFGAGILWTLVYHGTLVIMGKSVTIINVIIYFVVFVVIYSLLGFMLSKGKRK